jgi:hypothetical protein
MVYRSEYEYEFLLFLGLSSRLSVKIQVKKVELRGEKRAFGKKSKNFCKNQTKYLT